MERFASNMKRNGLWDDRWEVLTYSQRGSKSGWTQPLYSWGSPNNPHCWPMDPLLCWARGLVLECLTGWKVTTDRFFWGETGETEASALRQATSKEAFPALSPRAEEEGLEYGKPAPGTQKAMVPKQKHTSELDGRGWHPPLEACESRQVWALLSKAGF